MPSGDGGLGSALVGEKISVNDTTVSVTKLLGEGGFAYVYLVKELNDSNNADGEPTKRGSRNGSTQQTDDPKKESLVLKVTSILSRQQRDIAEKEAKLLSRLSHPSIVKMTDTCYRTVTASSSGFRKSSDDKKERAQHLILMEYCEGGHALDVCTNYAKTGGRFDLSTLIIAFGQICNAVSYLHAQRPPIVHRDLKPDNFLIKNGAYKLCDFGSAVFGHIELKNSKARSEAEEVIEKTTTQMFRAPEMVDLYMAKKLTQATDVWALGCCLYSLAFLKNCFEEGSNLAILSRKYKIPDDNPYGDGLAELIDRMLTEDSKARADMTEVILCLSAVYSGRPLPPKKERKKDKKESESKEKKEKKKKQERTGTYRTDGQGIQEDLTIDPKELKKLKEAKKLDPNSAAARRRQAAGGENLEFATFHSKFDEEKNKGESVNVNQDLAFSTTANPFASFDGNASTSGDNMFASFDDKSNDGDIAGAFDNEGQFDANFKNLSVRGRSTGRSGEKKTRSRSQDHRRSRRKDRDVAKKEETPEEAIDRLAAEDDEDLNNMAEALNKKKAQTRSRGVRRMTSSQSSSASSRSLSRGAGLRRTKSGTGRRRPNNRKTVDSDVSSEASSDSE